MTNEKLELADNALANLQSMDANQFNDPIDRRGFAKCLSSIAGLLSNEESRKSQASQAAHMGVSEAKRLVNEFPDNTDFLFNLADCLAMQGQQLLWWGEHNEDCFEAYQSCISLLLELDKKIRPVRLKWRQVGMLA